MSHGLWLVVGVRFGALGRSPPGAPPRPLLSLQTHAFLQSFVLCRPEDLAPGPGPRAWASLQQAESSHAHGYMSPSVAGTRAGLSQGTALPQVVDC